MEAEGKRTRGGMREVENGRGRGRNECEALDEGEVDVLATGVKP